LKVPVCHITDTFFLFIPFGTKYDKEIAILIMSNL
jgi:hypothetical protein